MSDTTTLNLNAAECLRNVQHFGYTSVHNVCVSTVYEYSWGLTDWLIFVGGVVGGSLFILLACNILLMMLRDEL